MINPPAEVSNDAVVTAEQWQNLAQYIHEVLWTRPYTYVINVVSQSTSRATTTASTGDTATQPTLDVAERPYIGVATGQAYNSTATATFGLQSVCDCKISMQARVDTFFVDTTEPVPVLPNGKTFYQLKVRTAGCITYFLGRPAS